MPSVYITLYYINLYIYVCVCVCVSGCIRLSVLMMVEFPRVRWRGAGVPTRPTRLVSRAQQSDTVTLVCTITTNITNNTTTTIIIVTSFASSSDR